MLSSRSEQNYMIKPCQFFVVIWQKDSVNRLHSPIAGTWRRNWTFQTNYDFPMVVGQHWRVHANIRRIQRHLLLSVPMLPADMQSSPMPVFRKNQVAYRLVSLCVIKAVHITIYTTNDFFHFEKKVYLHMSDM